MADPDWHRLPPLTTLRAFEATARLQGYSAASRSLNVTPAAIAQQVRKLEKDLGTSLVRREGRGLVLTDDGRDLAKTLHEAFNLIAQGVEDLQLRTQARGVRVSTTEYFVNVVVLPRLGSFWKRHPDVQVSFSPDGNNHNIDFDACDLAVRGGPVGHHWEGCVATPLLQTPIIISGAPSLLATGTALCDMPWLRERGMGGDTFQKVVTQAGCDPDRLNYIDPGSSRLEVGAALMGYGLIVCPEIMIHEELSDGRLVRVDAPVSARAVYYALRRPGVPSEAVQCLLDWLVDVSAPLSPEAPKT